MVTDGLGNVTMSKDEYEAFYRSRVERTAIALFAAMQANPDWEDSRNGAWDAVAMAKSLIRAIDQSLC